MSVQRADLVGTRHTLNITYPTPQETLLGSPVTLATSEQATPDFSYTIQSSDLPTFDGVLLESKLRFFIYASGKNNSGSTARNVSYRVKRNGSSLITATNLSATANQYWTINFRNAVDCAVGDVLDVFLWQSTGTDLDLQWYGFAMNYTRIKILKKNRVAVNVVFTPDGNFPAFTSGNPSAAASASHIFDFGNRAANPYAGMMDNNTTARTVYALAETGTGNGYLYRLQYGEVDPNTDIGNSATYYPYYKTHYKLTKIDWTPTKILL